MKKKDIYIATLKEFEQMTAEEIWNMRPIENLATSLAKDKLEDLRDTVNTLSAMSSVSNRKDALYLLIGYYTTQLKDIKDKNIFISYITNWNNQEFFEFILTDVSQYKNLYRYRDIVDSIYKTLNYKDKFTTEQEDIIKSIIQNAKWGVKLKKKFLDKFEDNYYDDGFF